MDDVHQLLAKFKESVALKYQIYNALFLTLPFEKLSKVGVELPILSDYCTDALANHVSPDVIINQFFLNVLHIPNFSEQATILFIMLQFVERQIVLLDALEGAAFSTTHYLPKHGGIIDLIHEMSDSSDRLEKTYDMLQSYRLRLVLTAHPTQFYPLQILEIIRYLTTAIKTNNLREITELLSQLGMTSFKNPTRPTPLDEAHIVIRYMEMIFYPSIKKIRHKLNKVFSGFTHNEFLPNVIELGFWPGGDRDGNPLITLEVTKQVSDDLKVSILTIYIKELTHLKRFLTFKNMWKTIDAIIERLNFTRNLTLSRAASSSPLHYRSPRELLNDLDVIRATILTQYSGLFVEKLNSVIDSVRTFGFYFASIDIRQNSRIHDAIFSLVLNHLAEKFSLNNDFLPRSANEKVTFLSELMSKPHLTLEPDFLGSDPLLTDVIGSLSLIKDIQETNGEMGAHRYIISNTQAAYQVLQVMFFAQLAGWNPSALNIDIVPLFETIHDLEGAEEMLYQLFQSPIYEAHIRRRGSKQYIMLGFSDSTKDGGYVTANWTITKSKVAISTFLKSVNINVVFFDGRGGPPARGGGNTYKTYRAIEGFLHQTEIETTIQGQTISTDFGTLESARFNIEHLFTSAIFAHFTPKDTVLLNYDESDLLEAISSISHKSYRALLEHPLFMPYLLKITPLPYYGELNIASRPSQRQVGPLIFSELRAIPYVGAWSLIKQNIAGFYGLGTALSVLTQDGKLEALKNLYRHSLYFKTLLENVMQTLLKTNFTITAYLGDDPTFGEFWHQLHAEYQLCTAMVKLITDEDELLEHDPVVRDSIILREHIVLPSLIIQQYAMIQLYKLTEAGKDKSDPTFKACKRLVVKSLATNANASRNSV